MFDKKSDYKWTEHHKRYKKHVANMPKKLMCQDCRGAGDWTEPILEDGSGPSEQCGWCEGTGFVTPYLRSFWLRVKKREKLIHYVVKLRDLIKKIGGSIEKRWTVSDIGFESDISVLRTVIEEMQEYIVQLRPDLINQIPRLRAKIKKKHIHELSLSRIEI